MGTCMKLRVLEEYLQSLDGFENPKVNLEQYVTPPHIAGIMMHTIQATYDDIEGKIVADLGTGCGMLASAATLLGAEATIGFEMDNDALDIFCRNKKEMEINKIDAVQCDVTRDLGRWKDFFDTVVMNPPFGTKHNAGIDVSFLQQAIYICTDTVYSLHKTSTRSHIMKKVKEWGVKPKVVAELRYDLPKSLKFHKKDSVDIAVDLWRFEVL